jgi:hypothetical protein
MDSPNFYIKDVINKFSELNDFRAELFKKNILTKDYIDENLFLIYNKFDQPSNSQLTKECRSIILDRNTKNIVSFSCETPLLNSQALEYLLLNQHGEQIITKCYEGTLLSIFFNNDKWYVSTRRCLNSEESVWGEKSHFKMFMEVLEKSDYESFSSFTDKLSKDKCYYFVLIHHQNKNIVDYDSEFGKEYKKLCLVFLKERETQKDLDLYNYNTSQLLDDNIFIAEKFNNLEDFDALNKKDMYSLPPKSEGVVIKVFDTKMNRYKLLKLQTVNYQFAKSTGSEKNIFMGLIHLYQNDKLVDFINQSQNLKKIVNPLNTYESYDSIGAIDGLFKVCTSELFELFRVLWDIKNGTHLNNELYKLLPKEYKDILFGIRGLYYKKKATNFENKMKTSDNKMKDSKTHYLQIKDIYQFLKTVPTENFCALLKMRKLMFNWVKVNPSVLDFGKISTKCDKVHLKLTAIYTNKLFPNIMPDDLPPNPNVQSNVQSNIS